MNFDGDDDVVRHWWLVVRDEGTLAELREEPLWEGRRVGGYFRNVDTSASPLFASMYVPAIPHCLLLTPYLCFHSYADICVPLW